MGRRRKYCSAQPYLDYIGVPEKERKKGHEEEKLECAVCWREIDKGSLKSRMKITVGKISYIPETWDICSECRSKGTKKTIKELIDSGYETIYGRDKEVPQERKE